MIVKYGLPQKVIFCKECVQSNQRPGTSPEFLKKNLIVPTAEFDEHGVCLTCKYFKQKKKIDWILREKKLCELLDKHRRTDGRFDVIVPGSGGKDSIYVAHILKYKYNMNPLTVTWAPHIYTDIGKKNFYNWLNAGFDNILITPNPKVHKTLTKKAFLNLLNPFQPFIIGQKNAAPRIALQFDVPLIMYGENQAESHVTSEDDLTSPLMKSEHFSTKNPNDEIFLSGVSEKQLYSEDNISKNDLLFYRPLPLEKIKKKKIEIHFFSHYYNWSPQKNYYYSKQQTGFETNEDGRSEGTYTKFSSLDDRIDGIHYYTMFIKFGQGRATSDACRDIRDGLITREEGVNLVKKYDGEFPKKYFSEILNYINLSKEKFWERINLARSEHLWEYKNEKWKLKHIVS